LVVDVSLAGTDQLLRPSVELLEIVRRVIEVLAPVEAEPAHVIFDGVDVLLLLLDRIGIVEPQVTAAAEFLRHAEIQANGLGVANVQVTVRLRRKTRDDGTVPSCIQVALDDVANEIASGYGCFDC
jgi:hypothetical protein